MKCSLIARVRCDLVSLPRMVKHKAIVLTKEQALHLLKEAQGHLLERVVMLGLSTNMFALFSFIGADPATDWLSGCAALDEQDFVLTERPFSEVHLDERWKILGRRPLPFETSYPGLFAVGDVQAGSIKRVAAAAAHSVYEYLAFAHCEPGIASFRKNCRPADQGKIMIAQSFKQHTSLIYCSRSSGKELAKDSAEVGRWSTPAESFASLIISQTLSR